jgi:hypothetical protein
MVNASPLLVFLGFLLPLTACSGGSGDPHAVVNPDPLGSGLRVRQVMDPTLPNHPADGASVNVTGAVVNWVDTFDETMDGKSIGTVYVQDVGSQAQYSGVGIYKPSFVPADLRIAPGDVLDFIGPYNESAKIGTATFTPPDVLPQLTKPIGQFRYEYATPPPVMIDPTDLNDFTKGRKWMWMLVTVPNVTIDRLSNDGKGRITAHITSDMTMNGVTISNENYNLQPTDFAPGTTFKSVTGIVTWFFSYHIAPRSAADLVQ